MTPASDLGVVVRPRLLAHLDRDVPLLLLRAPTGFGKSVLVRQWLSAAGGEGRAIARARVRPGEGDRDGFWISIVDALTDAGLPLPALANSRSPQSLAARMISSAGHPLTVWIDNFENVMVDGAEEALGDLAAHTPQLRLVIGMRSFREFAPHVLRQLPSATVTARELLFTPDEIGQLLRSAGLDADAELAATVHAGMGGWPAMVHGFAEAMAHDATGDVTALMDRVSTGWLHELLPRGASGAVIDFAIASSVAGHLTPSLAGVIADDESGPALLQRLVATGLLISEGSDADPQYRWTSAARKTLLDELERRAPDQRRTLHDRLSRWYADHEQPAQALTHAQAAQNWRLVVGIIDRHWRDLMLHHPGELKHAFLETPGAEFFSGPRPSPSRAIRSVFLQLDEPTVNAAILPALPAELAQLGSSAEGPAAIDAALACLLALRTSSRWTEAVELSDRIVAAVEAARASQPGPVADLYASVLFFAAETSLIAGDVLTATERFERAFRRASDGRFGYVEADAASKLALTHALHGNIRVTGFWLRRNVESAQATPPASWLAPFMYASRHTAEMLIATDRLDLAAAADAEAALLERVLPSTLSTYELYARSLLALSRQGAADVLEAIDRADAALAAPDRPEHYAALTAMIKADAYLALGHGNRAHRIVTGQRRGHRLLRTTHARLSLLAGEPGEALRLAADTEWERRASRRHRVEMLAIRAIAAERTGEHEFAVASLARAAANAEQSGMLRPFTTVPRDELAELASALPAAQRALIESALASRPVYPDSIALIKLTPREQQVLDRMVAGQSIQQIAVTLQLSYSTIRTQQRSLYRKLDAVDRPQALTRARNAGLISAG